VVKVTDIDHEADEDCPCGPTPIFVDGGIVYRHHPLVKENNVPDDLIAAMPWEGPLPIDVRTALAAVPDGWAKAGGRWLRLVMVSAGHYVVEEG
jgi:hypothetical protein